MGELTTVQNFTMMKPEHDYAYSNIEIGSSNSNFDLFLEATELININHPLVLQTSYNLTYQLSTDHEKVLSIYNFVKDEILFGWTANFSAMKASDVIKSKIGFSNTKSTLFVALLRAINIPARQVFVDITCDIFYGFGISSDFVDHSYCEIYLQNSWIQIDSYNIDKNLYIGAKKRLERENLKVGYGIHANGTNDWNGKDNSFVQFLNDGFVQHFTSTYWGVQTDTLSFYTENDGTNNNYDLFFPLNLMNTLFFWNSNSAVCKIRNEAALYEYD